MHVEKQGGTGEDLRMANDDGALCALAASFARQVATVEKGGATPPSGVSGEEGCPEGAGYQGIGGDANGFSKDGL